MTNYTVEPNLADWIPLPGVFPNETWQTPEEWASSIAEAAIKDDEETRGLFRKYAIDVIQHRNDQADHSFWFAPEDGSSMGVATLNVYVDEPGMTLEEVVAPPYESLSRQQFDSVASETFGEIIQSFTTFSTEQIVPGEPARSVVGHIRMAGRAGRGLFVLNAFDSDTVTLAIMVDPMVELLESITITS